MSQGIRVNNLVDLLLSGLTHAEEAKAANAAVLLIELGRNHLGTALEKAVEAAGNENVKAPGHLLHSASRWLAGDLHDGRRCSILDPFLCMRCGNRWEGDPSRAAREHVRPLGEALSLTLECGSDSMKARAFEAACILRHPATADRIRTLFENRMQHASYVKAAARFPDPSFSSWREEIMASGEADRIRPLIEECTENLVPFLVPAAMELHTPELRALAIGRGLEAAGADNPVVAELLDRETGEADRSVLRCIIEACVGARTAIPTRLLEKFTAVATSPEDLLLAAKASVCAPCTPPALLQTLIDGWEELGWELKEKAIPALFNADERPSSLEELLVTAARSGEHADLVKTALKYLYLVSPATCTKIARRHLSSRSPRMRAAVMRALPAMQDGQLMEQAARYTADDREVASALAAALPALPPSVSIPMARRLLKHSNHAVRLATARSCSEIPDPEALALLVSTAAASDDPRMRSTCVMAIGGFEGEDTIEPLSGFLQDDDVRVRANAIEALGHSSSLEAIPLLRPFLDSPNNRCRLNAMCALWQCGDLKIPALVASHIERGDENSVAGGLYAARVIGESLLAEALLTRYPMLEAALSAASKALPEDLGQTIRIYTENLDTSRLQLSEQAGETLPAGDETAEDTTPEHRVEPHEDFHRRPTEKELMNLLDLEQGGENPFSTCTRTLFEKMKKARSAGDKAELFRAYHSLLQRHVLLLGELLEYAGESIGGGELDEGFEALKHAASMMNVKPDADLEVAEFFFSRKDAQRSLRLLAPRTLPLMYRSGSRGAELLAKTAAAAMMSGYPRLARTVCRLLIKDAQAPERFRSMAERMLRSLDRQEE